MSEQVIYLTQQGLEKLQEELRSLKDEKRIEIAEKLKEAISFWDLSENSEYEDARNEQAQVELRITELEDQLKRVEIIVLNFLGIFSAKVSINFDIGALIIIAIIALNSPSKSSFTSELFSETASIVAVKVKGSLSLAAPKTSLFGAAITYAARSRLCVFYNSLLVDVFGFLRFQARLPISELCLLSKTPSLGSGAALGLSVRRFSCSK